MTLMNNDEAGEYLSLSPRTLEGKRVNGTGPKFIRISARCIRYRQEELDEWIESLVIQKTIGKKSKRKKKRG